jgi:hypothetical protein
MHLRLSALSVLIVCLSLLHVSSAHTLRPLHAPSAASLSIDPRGITRKGASVMGVPRTGATVAAADETGKWSLRENLWKNALGVWGVMQVVSILANAIKRLYPIAIQPILQRDLLPFQWALYVGWALYMGYAEGYKAFQCKFAPLVVQRAFSLVQNPSILNYALAGPYSMGLFNAPRKRMIIGWSITAGVFSIVKLVKMLPYPYRSIVDAGVVVGLSYGTLSICVLALKAFFGGKVEVPSDEVKSK